MSRWLCNISNMCRINASPERHQTMQTAAQASLALPPKMSRRSLLAPFKSPLNSTVTLSSTMACLVDQFASRLPAVARKVQRLRIHNVVGPTMLLLSIQVVVRVTASPLVILVFIRLVSIAILNLPQNHLTLHHLHLPSQTLPGPQLPTQYLQLLQRLLLGPAPRSALRAALLIFLPTQLETLHQ
jgi:hypothetical protein